MEVWITLQSQVTTPTSPGSSWLLLYQPTTASPICVIQDSSLVADLGMGLEAPDLTPEPAVGRSTAPGKAIC